MLKLHTVLFLPCIWCVPICSYSTHNLKFGGQLAKQQTERDDTVAGLIEALGSAYDFVAEAQGLPKQSGPQTATIAALSKLTINCGKFIQNYMSRSFCKYRVGHFVLVTDRCIVTGARAVSGALTPIDQEISDYRSRFKKLRENLTLHGVLASQRGIHGILGKIETLGTSGTQGTINC